MMLSRAEWTRREQAHQQRADALTADHRERAARREKHPVWDFLFTYYGYKPAQLRRWHPGAGIALDDAVERRDWRWYASAGSSGAVPDAAMFADDKPQLAALVERMLRRTASRPGQFGCFGLHEWAMVYRQDENRHPVPLRLGRTGTDAVVEDHDLRCTHFDAFRFFTPDAVPLNRTPLTRDDQPLFEQPGCLHAGMDLYKWATKLGPLIPGELLLDTFELGRDIRLLDMEAAPYDLSAWGVVPVRIETSEGKAEYVRRQRVFADRGAVLRSALLEAWLGAPIAA
ncbi:3-methyladenine DNA glycosylase [Microbacterium sp. ZW T5_45]|uniref:3-methyladenine DNA glycosylase n=1 Tax=Microbacterium sp. ZW T5_45 TaxID=3378080 RepID=UPI003851923C